MCCLSARLLLFSVVFVFTARAVNDESRKNHHLMLDLCELFLCCGSSHTVHTKQGWGASSGSSLNTAFNLVIGVHLCCINGQAVTLAASSSDPAADWWERTVQRNWKQTECFPLVRTRTCFYMFPFSLFLRFETCNSMNITNKPSVFALSPHLILPPLSQSRGASQCLCQSLRCCHQCSSASLSVCYCVYGPNLCSDVYR